LIKDKIAVIDYGMGNLRSVEKALQVSGGRALVTSSAAGIKSCSKIVFPGVGAFGDAMAELKRRRLVKPIISAIRDGVPFLGLCLGLQLLFEKSEEASGVNGLGVLKGEVRKFRLSARGLKVPHMGWNEIAYSAERVADSKKIFKDVPNGSYMYFVHSYYVKPKDKNVILTTTGYGIEFVSGVAKDNVYGLQFHPEKSQKAGLKIMENFVRMR
jgi:glutamine amidotransferase